MYDLIEKFLKYIIASIVAMSITSSTVIYYIVRNRIGFDVSLELYSIIIFSTLVLNLLTFIVCLHIFSDK